MEVIYTGEQVRLEATPVQMYRIRAKCEECDGEFESTDEKRIVTEGRKKMEFEHQCSGCGIKVWLDTRYPYNGEKDLRWRDNKVYRHL